MFFPPELLLLLLLLLLRTMPLLLMPPSPELSVCIAPPNRSICPEIPKKASPVAPKGPDKEIPKEAPELPVFEASLIVASCRVRARCAAMEHSMHR
jgi:hypothetical protein